MPLFERYVMVDWSARAKPATGRDSIWIGVHGQKECNPRTRMEAFGHLRNLLVDPIPTLVGFDFALGYPKGFADALRLTGEPWIAAWREITGGIQDNERNRNNRFEAASEWNRRYGQPLFWGCPKSAASRWLCPKKAARSLPEFRETERAARGTKAVWQLFGNGCVGSQSLMGLPYVHRLREEFAGRVRVWPFETGLSAPTRPDIVFAEIYPSMIPVERRGDEVLDRAQVRSMAQHFAGLDTRGELAALFAPRCEDPAAVVREEGWILGVRR
ncbi:MAG: hypothetical protein R2729_30810 [Bryobacteraceae bacterium]